MMCWPLDRLDGWESLPVFSFGVPPAKLGGGWSPPTPAARLMTPTGRACVGRSYFLPARARERARDDWNSEFNFDCAVGCWFVLGGLTGWVPVRRARGSGVSAGRLRCNDGRRRVGHAKQGTM